MKKILLCTLSSIVSCLLFSGAALPAAQGQSSAQQSTPMQTGKPAPLQSSHAAKTGSARSSRYSASDIAGAKARGMVWVNTESKVYHTGGRYYGNTQHGQFMTEADAKRAGYKAARR